MKKEIPSSVLAILLTTIMMFIFYTGCEPGSKKTDKPTGESEKLLYERNLKDLVRKGYFVLVDEKESDRFIQEDIYSNDYGILLELSMIKAETMGTPLYTENIRTLGTEDYIERIHPSDRKAKQNFRMIETKLLDPSYFDQKKYLDNTFNRAEAMNKEKTLDEMLKFIDAFPDSKWVSPAISYIEYILCAYQKDPAKALKVYKEIKKKHADKKQLNEIIDVYIERAHQYKTQYHSEKNK